MGYRQGELRGRYIVDVEGSEEGAIGAINTEYREFHILAVDEAKARDGALKAAYACGLDRVLVGSCREVPKHHRRMD